MSIGKNYNLYHIYDFNAGIQEVNEVEIYTETIGESKLAANVNYCNNGMSQNRCHFDEVGDGVAYFGCNGSTTELVSAYCGGKTFDKSKSFCEGNIIHKRCGGKLFNTQYQTCVNDTIRRYCRDNDDDKTCVPKGNAKKKISKECNEENEGRFYFSYADRERTIRDVVDTLMYCNGDMWFELSLQNLPFYIKEPWPRNTDSGWEMIIKSENDKILKSSVNEYGLSDEKFFIYNDEDNMIIKKGDEFFEFKNMHRNEKVFDFCNGKLYYIGEQYRGNGYKCENNKIVTYCEGEPLDTEKYFCYWDKKYELCGGKKYNFYFVSDGGYGKCENDNFFEKCGEEYIDSKKYFCSRPYSTERKVYERCDGKWYLPETEKCINNKIVNK